MKCLCWLLTPTIYFILGFITFAVIWDAPKTEWELRVGANSSGRELGSVFSIFGWPIYWAATGALYAVRYAKTHSPTVMCKDAAGNAWKPTAEGVCLLPAR